MSHLLQTYQAYAAVVLLRNRFDYASPSPLPLCIDWDREKNYRTRSSHSNGMPGPASETRS